MNLLLQSNSEQRGWQKASFIIDEDMGRFMHTSVIVGQYLVIIGGFSNLNMTGNANLVVFDLQKGTCSQVEISGRKSIALYNHSTCYWKDNQIIMYGGLAGFNDVTTSEVGIITLSFTECLKAEWRAVETDSKIRRRGHSAHIYKNQMIVLGGTSDPNEFFQGIHILNLDDFKWIHVDLPKKPLAGGMFYFSRSALYGNKIYIFENCNSQESIKSMFSSLDLETYEWKELPLEIGDHQLHFAKIQAHNGKIYLVQRALSESRLVLKSFDINQGKWSSDLQPKDQSLMNITEFSLSVYDDQLVLYVGTNSNASSAFGDLWLFKLDDSKTATQNQPHENIIKTFLREAPYSDVIFEVESEQIPAHKWWLCQKSKYFANMFSSGRIEAKSSKIVISDMSAATFRGFLEYLYSEDIELDFTLAKDLLTQADKYSVPELKAVCEQFLINNVSADNYVLLASLSELLEANKLRDAVRDYISKNIKVLKVRKDFEKISIDMLRDVVVKVTVR